MSCWLATMPDISVHNRVIVLDSLERTARYLNLLASWLGEQGAAENEADMIDGAARDLLAAAFLLERPLKPKLPPQQWAQPAQQDGWQQ